LYLLLRSQQNNMMDTFSCVTHNEFIVIIINPNNVIKITTVAVSSIDVYCIIWFGNNLILSSNVEHSNISADKFIYIYSRNRQRRSFYIKSILILHYSYLAAAYFSCVLCNNASYNKKQVAINLFRYQKLWVPHLNSFFFFVHKNKIIAALM